MVINIKCVCGAEYHAEGSDSTAIRLGYEAFLKAHKLCCKSKINQPKGEGI